jgi:hypothetical protein
VSGAQVLTLDTTAPAALTVAIDGTAYPFRQLAEFSIGALKTIEGMVLDVETLLGQEAVDAAEDDALSLALAVLCERVLSAPADVQARLNTVQRSLIFRVFHTQFIATLRQTTGV